jgi:hypothetical protein
MVVFTSRVTAKGRTIIPEALRAELSIQPGQRLAWWIENGRLLALPVRGLVELSGCLASEIRFPGVREERYAVRELRARSRGEKPGRL